MQVLNPGVQRVVEVSQTDSRVYPPPLFSLSIHSKGVAGHVFVSMGLKAAESEFLQLAKLKVLVGASSGIVQRTGGARPAGLDSTKTHPRTDGLNGN